MDRTTPMTRAELELAVRAELVDIGASSWQARLAADYILATLDDYVQSQAEQMETRLREMIDFYLQAQATAGRRADPALARWIAKDCHRALCHDKSHAHEETPWSSALSHPHAARRQQPRHTKPTPVSERSLARADRQELDLR